MKKIVLLKDYKDWNKGNIIEVSNNEAFGLIDSEIARQAENRDFIVKPEFYNANTKAFSSPPNSTKGRVIKRNKIKNE